MKAENVKGNFFFFVFEFVYIRGMNKDIILRQPYAVTLAQHRLDVHEMRVIFRVIEALQPDVKYKKSVEEVGKTLFGNKVLRLRTKDLLPGGSKNYGRVRRALKSLRKKDITIEGKNEKGETYVCYTGLILKSNYYQNNEFVEIELCKELLPSFLALAKNYSKYLLEVAFNASSPNVMKLYQFVSTHYWRGDLQKDVYMEDLRDWLLLGEKYPDSKNFRVRILEPAIKELKEKADVYFELKEPIKPGRKIIGWKIRIFKKGTTQDELKKSQQTERNIRHYLKEMFRFKEKDFAPFEKYIKSPEWQPHFWNAMHRVAKKLETKQVDNRRAYMIKTLENEI